MIPPGLNTKYKQNLLLFLRHKMNEINSSAQVQIRVNMLFTYLLPFAWIAAVLWHNPNAKAQSQGQDRLPQVFAVCTLYFRSKMHATSLLDNLQIFCNSLFFVMFYLRNWINKPLLVIPPMHLLPMVRDFQDQWSMESVQRTHVPCLAVWG